MSYDVDFVAGYTRIKTILRELERHDDAESFAQSPLDAERCIAGVIHARDAVRAYPDVIADDANWQRFLANFHTFIVTMDALDAHPEGLRLVQDSAGLMKMHMNRMQGAALSHDPDGVTIRYRDGGGHHTTLGV